MAAVDATSLEKFQLKFVLVGTAGVGKSTRRDMRLTRTRMSSSSSSLSWTPCNPSHPTRSGSLKSKLTPTPCTIFVGTQADYRKGNRPQPTYPVGEDGLQVVMPTEVLSPAKCKKIAKDSNSTYAEISSLKNEDIDALFQHVVRTVSTRKLDPRDGPQPSTKCVIS